MERGKRNISLVNIQKLARALKLEPGELLGVPRKDRAIRTALKQLEEATRCLEEMNEIIERQGGGELPLSSERLKMLKLFLRP